MKVVQEVIESWEGIGSWLRLNMKGGVGWKYSGYKELGWSWGMWPGSDNIIWSEPESYINMYKALMKDLVGGGEELSINLSEGKFVMSIKKGEHVWGAGNGSDRISAMLCLLGSLGESYWDEFAPNLKSFDSNGVDLFEDRDGVFSVTFSNYYDARDFFEKHKMFSLKKSVEQKKISYGSISNVINDGEVFWGEIMMIEGVIRVYSRYGESADIKKFMDQVKDLYGNSYLFQNPGNPEYYKHIWTPNDTGTACNKFIYKPGTGDSSLNYNGFFNTFNYKK